MNEVNAPTPLKRAIFEKGLKQTDLAVALDIRPDHLSRIVNGLRPSPQLATQIARRVGMKVGELWPR